VVATKLTARGRFRQVEEADARVVALELADDGSHLGADAIAADQNFQVLDALLLHAADRVGKGRTVIMSW